MAEHPGAEQIRAFLDDRLDDDETRRVEAHLEGCHRCQRALEDAEPQVALPEGDQADGWDEGRMRRAVRRALLRTAFDVLSIAVVAVIVASAVGVLVVHPLFVDRGDRFGVAAEATADIPVLWTPGAVVRSTGTGRGIFSSTHTAHVERYIGARARDLGSFEARLGAWRWQPVAGQPMPGDGSWRAGDEGLFDPERVPAGTVASVMLDWREGSRPTLSEADALAAGSDQVSLQWVGFAVDLLRPGRDAARVGWSELTDVGYSACHTAADRPSIGGSRGPSADGPGAPGPPGPPGAEFALRQARRATANLAEEGPVRRHLRGSGQPVRQRIDDVADWLADHEPDVAAVVLTGPTEDLAEVLEDTEAEAVLLDMDFYNGPGSDCG